MYLKIKRLQLLSIQSYRRQKKNCTPAKETRHLSEFEIELRVDKISNGSKVFSPIMQSDEDTNPNTFKEKLRPQFHFSPKRGWTNDPNGMVYFNGEYHLFYQHNP